MSNLEKRVAISYSTGAVTPAIQALDDEFDLVYQHLTKGRGLQAGPVRPSNPNANDLWFDTRVASFGLKYWTGGENTEESWVAVAANGNFGSGVRLDAGVAGFTARMILDNPGTTKLQVVASALAPATVAVDDVLLQNVATAESANFVTESTGLYYMFAYRESSTSTTWKLGKSESLAEASGRRYIGIAYWDKDLQKFPWVESFERPTFPAKIPGLFHYKQTVAQEIPQQVPADEPTVLKFTPATDLVRGDEQLMPEADGVLVLNRAGVWEVNVRFMIDNGTGTHIDTEHHTTYLYLRHYTGTTLNAEDRRVERRGSGLKEISADIRGTLFYAQVGDLVKASVILDPDVNEPHFHTLPAGCQLWGRYLGPA